MNIAIVAGFINITIGILLTAASVFFIGGLLNYLFHLGTFHREHGLERMHQGVVMLVMVAVLIGLTRLLQWLFHAITW